jgi:broad specificity phosphatase PhoE
MTLSKRRFRLPDRSDYADAFVAGDLPTRRPCMPRRSFLRVLTLLLIGAAVPAGIPVKADPAPTPGEPALVLLVRHAEKAKEAGSDPPLTAAGTQRAQDLALALRDAGVTAIITSQLRRTGDTATPLATALKLTPEVVQVGDDTDAHATAVAAAVRRHAGEVVLVVGHSDTVPAIIAALGGPEMPEICATQFSNLFVLEPKPGGGARVVRSFYGAPDQPPAPACGE